MTEKENGELRTIQLILEGDSHAQNVLYYKYSKIVSDYLNRKYSTHSYLDDDVSEIMIKVFTNIGNFNINKSKFKSWVLTLTNNYMIDKWRSCSSSYTTTSLDVDFADTCYMNNSITIDTNDSFISSSSYLADCSFDNCSSISHVANQITAQDYTLLDMKYVQGYNYNEIGSEFSSDSTTIRNRVNYIKDKLKKNNTEIIY